MCSTNYIFLEWSVSTARQPSLHETRSISNLDQNVVVSPILINSANFTFSRDSSPRDLPLVSTITIMNVTSNLEGTVIRCTGLNSSSVSSVVLMTTIHLYDINVGRLLIRISSAYSYDKLKMLTVNTDFPNTPGVVIRPDMIHFGNENFTLTLEWPQFSGETYSVAIVPEAVYTRFTMSTSVQLVMHMLYNIQYNVTITATLCGNRSTANLIIYYGNAIIQQINKLCGNYSSSMSINYLEHVRVIITRT